VSLDLERRIYTASGTGRYHPLAEGLDIRLLSADFQGLDRRMGEFRFWPDGSASGGEVVLGAGGRAYVVAVQWLTGRVTIRERHETD
jgi:general secretion pathway protein H